MRYRITHTTKYAYSAPVAVCHNLARLEPRRSASQRCNVFRLVVVPEPSDLTHRTDPYGNRVAYFSTHEAHWGLTLKATSEVAVDPPPPVGPGAPWESVRDALPDREPDRAAYEYAFASTLVPTDARLAAYAAESFTPERPINEALADLTRRVYEDFDYNPSATDVGTPTLAAFEKRAGVCQDFAHIQIGCLRSLGLAARYVSGYLRTLPPPGKPRLVGADASHAWLSLYAGDDGWVDADPTNNCRPGTDHITIGHGRDYADICPIQGVYVGGGKHTLSVSVDVAPLDVAGPPGAEADGAAAAPAETVAPDSVGEAAPRQSQGSQSQSQSGQSQSQSAGPAPGVAPRPQPRPKKTP